MAQFAITTIDNPYDPLDEFEKWFQFDIDKGYNTCGYLARMAHTSNQFTDEENEAEVLKAINRIIELDFMNIYRKIKR